MMDIDFLGYMEPIEFEEGYDQEVSLEEDKPYCIQSMLFEDFSKEEEDVWISMWTHFAAEDKKTRLCWNIGNVEFQGTIYKNILSNLQWLKKKAPDIFSEVFDKDFVMALIVHLAQMDSIFVRALDIGAKRLGKWISKNLDDAITEEEFWEGIDCILDGLNRYGFLNCVRIWNYFFDIPIHVDFKNNKKLLNFFTNIVSCDSEKINEVEFECQKNAIKDFLEPFDEVENSKSIFLKKEFKNMLDGIINHGDEEFVHMLLAKRFIDKDMIQQTMNLAITQNKLELMPLFILRKFDET